MRSSLAAACGLALALTPSGGSTAQGKPAHEAVQLVAAVIAPNAATESAVLVGSSGQLYEPAGGGSWRRTLIGGVASEVTGAVEDGRGTLYAVATEAPIYRHSQGAWHAHPLPNRGPSVLAPPGGVPALAIDRHVYTLRGPRWVRLIAAPARIQTLWASSTRRVYIADTDGALRYSEGRTWKDVSHGLAEGDHIAEFAGVPGKELYAIAASGAVLDVGTKSATPAKRPPELEGYRPRVACPDLRPGQRGVLMVGPAPGPDGSTRLVLAAAAGGELRLLEELPGLAHGDQLALLYAGPDGELLLATRRGVVRLRAADGTWREGRVSGSVPETATRRFSGAAPAHAR